MLVPFLISGILLIAFTAILIKSNAFQIPTIPRWLVVSAFYAKLLGGLMIWYIYTYHYKDRSNADIYKYFDDAQTIMEASSNNKHLRWHLFSPSESNEPGFNEILKDTQHWDRSSSFLFNDNRSIIRINFILLFLSKGFFHLHTLIFCIFSFIGCIALLRFFLFFSKAPPLLLFLFIFLIPSTLLFTSGAIKESWLFFCLGHFLFFTMKALTQKRYLYLITALLFSLLLINIKSYVAICLIPAISFLVLAQFIKLNRLLLFGIIHLGLLLFLFYFHHSIVQSFIQKQTEFILLAQESNASSYFEIIRFSNLKELTLAIPGGIYNVWFRPFMHLTTNPLVLISALESLFLVLLVPIAIIYFNRPQGKELNLMFFCFSFVFILTLVIGLNIPILGAVLRYKVPLLAFYSVLILSFIDFNKVPTWARDFSL